MRTRPLPMLTLVLSLAAAAACGDLDQVDVPLSYTLEVAGGLAPSGPVPGTGTTVSRSLENEGVAPEDVDSARLTKLTLLHVQPDCTGVSGCDLSFIDRIEVRVEAPGRPRAVVGLLESPQGRSAEVPLRDLDLAPYVTAAQMTLSADIRGEVPVRSVELRLEGVLQVDVDVF